MTISFSVSSYPIVLALSVFALEELDLLRELSIVSLTLSHIVDLLLKGRGEDFLVLGSAAMECGRARPLL